MTKPSGKLEFAYRTIAALEQKLEAAQARVAELESATGYAEARQCATCKHIGINDSSGTAACHDCDWRGPEPAEDKCPGCGSVNCMAAACPECGGRYELMAEAKVAAPVAQAGQVPEEWQPMDTAPKDGSLIRLLVHFEDMSIDDGEGPFATIGQNNLDNDGEDRWQVVGWCWEHDHFTDGKGTPVGWLPMLAAAPAQGGE